MVNLGKTVEYKDVTFYVQVEPQWSTWVSPSTDQRSLTGLKLANTTSRPPVRPKSGTALVKLTLRLPVSAFLPLRPEAVIVVPADMVSINPIEVEAQPPPEES